jgi:membrane protein implicated in regulation of membrane protease activity
MNDRPRPPLISAGWVVSLLLLAGLLCVASWILRGFGVRNVNPAVAVVGLPVLIVVGGLVLLGVALTVSAVRRRRALDRERRGLCSRCGYDLRGTRHELCPECGLLVLRRRDPVTGKELD